MPTPLATALALLLGLLPLVSTSAHARGERFLTGPSRADPLEAVLEYAARHRAALGLEAGDLDEWRVRDRYVTRHNGVTHLYVRQLFRGLDVAGADLAATIDRDGRIVRLFNGLQRGVRRAAVPARAALSATEAVERAARALDLPLRGRPRPDGPPQGPERRARLRAEGASRDPVPVHLVYQPHGRALRLAWDLVLRTGDGRHWWNLRVDAVSGAVLFANDWIAHDGYKVFPLPIESPALGPRSLVSDPADPVASPHGWHDTDGLPGAERTDTAGANAIAQEDADADDVAGARPDGGPGLVFDFPLDPDLPPASHADAAVTNLFYWTNVLHDVHHRYGFDEASGNFQQDNLGRGGLGSDPVLADAQDGAGLDNAVMGVPPDGASPRLEIYLWRVAFLEVHAPAPVAGDIWARPATFGPPLDAVGVSGTVARGLDPSDPSGPSPTDGCSALDNPEDVSGRVALLDRGSCPFVTKVANAEAAGAIGVLVVDDDDQPFTMNGSGVEPGIPSAMIGRSDGERIAAELASGVLVTLSGGLRDGDLDGGLIAHEYGHGVSARLTGGPANVNCLKLSQSNALGEGWSDWWALAMTTRPPDARTDPRGFVPWLLAGPRRATIRALPYSTDLAVNDLHYGDFGDLVFAHDRGAIWAEALWELYWNLVETEGFDPDLLAGSGGNNAALQLVADGLKLQPCEPTYLDARDAILDADLLGFGGVHWCRIWGSFAKRGLGSDAADGGSAAALTVTAGFGTPAGCPVCGDVSGDERADLLDSVLLRRALVGQGPALAAPERCNVRGPADPSPGPGGLTADCDSADAAGLRNGLAGRGPGRNPLCAAPAGPLP